MYVGTPVSNSMTELFVMTRYLRPDLLEQAGISRFDEWAATFGNVTTQLEQTAYDTYKLKTRFSQFTNLPELMAFYKEFADIKSAKKLDLPRPKLKNGKYTIVSVPATPEQKAYVEWLGERAFNINSGLVPPHEDNFLKITGEARIIGLGNQVAKALYARNGKKLPPEFVDINEKNSKVDACVENVYDKWKETTENKGVQIIFSDVAVNSDNGNFSAYDYIKEELIAKGIPENEIIFAPKSDCKDRLDIFKRINSGEHRVVIASTETLGTGANIQQKLVKLHNLDIPWTPKDFEQREGRGLRQGNENDEIEIACYVSEGTLDSYLYSGVIAKAKFIAQVLDDENPARVCEDCDEKVLTFAEIQAIAAGKPEIKERIEVSNRLAELNMFKREYGYEKARMREYIAVIPPQLETAKKNLAGIKVDIPNAIKVADIEEFPLSNESIRAKISQAVANFNDGNYETVAIGTVAGFDVGVAVKGITTKYLTDPPTVEINAVFSIKGETEYSCDVGFGSNDNNALRIKNAFAKIIPARLETTEDEVKRLSENLEQAQSQIDVPFEYEDEIIDLEKRLTVLNGILSGISVQEEVIGDSEEIVIDEPEPDNKNSQPTPDSDNPDNSDKAQRRKIA